MWVKRTNEEIVATKSRAKRSRIYLAIFMGVFGCVMIALFHGRGWSTRYASSHVPLDEVPSRIPFSIVGGTILGWCTYRFFPRQRTLVCPKCEKAKNDDSQLECPCGGHFEDMESMKWI